MQKTIVTFILLAPAVVFGAGVKKKPKKRLAGTSVTTLTGTLQKLALTNAGIKDAFMKDVVNQPAFSRKAHQERLVAAKDRASKMQTTDTVFQLVTKIRDEASYQDFQQRLFETSNKEIIARRVIGSGVTGWRNDVTLCDYIDDDELWFVFGENAFQRERAVHRDILTKIGLQEHIEQYGEGICDVMEGLVFPDDFFNEDISKMSHRAKVFTVYAWMHDSFMMNEPEMDVIHERGRSEEWIDEDYYNRLLHPAKACTAEFIQEVAASLNA